MHLLNAAVAVASALAGTVGATVAYGAMNTTPVGHTVAPPQPVTLTQYLPCEPPSTLKDGVCVTHVVRKVVKTAEPIVITTVEKSRSPKAKVSTPATAVAPPNDDHGDEDGDEDDHGYGTGSDTGEDYPTPTPTPTATLTPTPSPSSPRG